MLGKQLNTGLLVSISSMPSGVFSWIIHQGDGNTIGLLWYPLLAGLHSAEESCKALGRAGDCQGSWHAHA